MFQSQTPAMFSLLLRWTNWFCLKWTWAIFDNELQNKGNQIYHQPRVYTYKQAYFKGHPQKIPKLISGLNFNHNTERRAKNK